MSISQPSQWDKCKHCGEMDFERCVSCDICRDRVHLDEGIPFGWLEWESYDVDDHLCDRHLCETCLGNINEAARKLETPNEMAER